MTDAISVFSDVDAVVKVLEQLRSMTGVGGPVAAVALGAVDAGLLALIDALKGNLTPSDAFAAIGRLAAGLAANDANADAALRDRQFGAETKP